MSSWKTSDDDRVAGPVLSPNATPWSCCERPVDRSRTWHCCIKRSARSACTRVPKSPAACCEMTVLYRSFATPEVSAAPLCPPLRAPSPLMQQSRCPSAPARVRTGGRPAVAMAYKLLDTVQARWRRLNGHGRVALFPDGTEFIDGKLRERDDHEREFEGAPPETTLAMINDDLPCLSLVGRASAGTAGRKALPNHSMARSWPIRTPHADSTVRQVGFLQEFLSTSCSRESYKTVKSAGQEGYSGSTNGRPRPR